MRRTQPTYTLAERLLTHEWQISAHPPRLLTNFLLSTTIALVTPGCAKSLDLGSEIQSFSVPELVEGHNDKLNDGVQRLILSASKCDCTIRLLGKDARTNRRV